MRTHDVPAFDVAIAGAGPAGASLALRLAREGCRVVLVDAGRFPREKLCGEFLSPEGVLALDRLGLAGGLDDLGGVPIHRVRLTTPRGRLLDADLTPSGSQTGFALSRGVLDHRLIAQARDAGVTLMEESRISGPIVQDGRVVGLAARHPTIGPSLQLRATVVIAADGRHSALVRQTGTTRHRGWLRPRFFGLKRHGKAPRTDDPPGILTLNLVPGGYVGTCSIEGGLTNICGLLPESTVRRSRGDLDRLARDTFPCNPALARLWSAIDPVGPWKAVAGVSVDVSRPRTPGILYVGDCQGTVDPLGGQGMTMALLGAEQLVPFVLHAVRRGGAVPGIQDEVQRAWHQRFDRRIQLCRLFHHVLINPGLIDAATCFRRLGIRLLTAGYESTRDQEPRAVRTPHHPRTTEPG
jgi:flavin-dependent dehydrogenase